VSQEEYGALQTGRLSAADKRYWYSGLNEGEASSPCSLVHAAEALILALLFAKPFFPCAPL